jgi:hypothetical protein
MVVLLTLCLGALLGDKEPPQVWAALANCTALAKSTRRDCILELFRRHVKPGIPLSEVARLLDHPNWLKDEDVHFYDVIAGHIPVRCGGGDCIYHLQIFHEYGPKSGWIYFSVSRPASYSGGVDMSRLFQGRSRNDDLKKQVIVDFWVTGMTNSAADE